MINVAAVVAIIVIVILASVPLVQVDRTSVAWFGIKLGPGPGDLISYGHPGEFCPPQGGSDWAGVTGNVTLSFTWATKSGDPIENFSLWGEDYLKSPGSYLYRENNSSAGNFSSESPTIAQSVCNFSLDFSAGLASTDSVAIAVVVSYTYQATVPEL